MDIVTGSPAVSTIPANKGSRRDRKRRGSKTSMENALTEPVADGPCSEECCHSTEKSAIKKVKFTPGLLLPETMIELAEAELYQQSDGALTRLYESPKQAENRLEKMCDVVRTLLECVGEDSDREGLQSTPLRYAKALLFSTKGYQMNVDNLVNHALFHEGHDEMVIVKDIEIYSLCEHHLVPFIGKMHIGYVPSGTVIGLSKLPRIAEMFAQRLQIQERLTIEVAEAIMEILKPQGVAVVMDSSHLCMVMRGVEKSGTTTTTSCVRGCFETHSQPWDTFLNLIRAKG